jgi:hypothetical protein
MEQPACIRQQAPLVLLNSPIDQFARVVRIIRISHGGSFRIGKDKKAGENNPPKSDNAAPMRLLGKNKVAGTIPCAVRLPPLDRFDRRRVSNARMPRNRSDFFGRGRTAQRTVPDTINLTTVALD